MNKDNPNLQAVIAAMREIQGYVISEIKHTNVRITLDVDQDGEVGWSVGVPECDNLNKWYFSWKNVDPLSLQETANRAIAKYNDTTLDSIKRLEEQLAEAKKRAGL